VVLFAVFVLLQVMSNWKSSCQSSVISMRSYPPQYPRSSTPHPPPLFFFLFPPFPIFLPPHPFSLFFSLFFSLPFLFVLFSFLSFFPDSPIFLFPFALLLFLLFFVCVRVCAYLRMYVRAFLAILSVNDNVKRIKSNMRFVFDKQISKMKKMWNI